MTTPNVKHELLSMGDYVWGRLSRRLVGLTDEELFWEPAPGCWTVHPEAEGSWVWDHVTPDPEPPPLTTIAWRVAHIAGHRSTGPDGGNDSRLRPWLGLQPLPAREDYGLPTDAASAVAMVERAASELHDALSEVSEDELWKPIGPIGGFYANHTRVAAFLHGLDELVHHAAEIALMRDLFRATRARDPFVTACLAADRAEVERLVAADPSVVGRVGDAEPALAVRAAEARNMDAVRLVAELGFDLDAMTSRSALHYSAGTGDLDVVRTLIELGADPGALDGTYKLTPLGWAEYFGRREVAEFLRPLTPSRSKA